MANLNQIRLVGGILFNELIDILTHLLENSEDEAILSDEQNWGCGLRHFPI